MNELLCIINAASKYLAVMPFDCSFVICESDGMIIKFLPAKSFSMGPAREGIKVAPGGSLEQCLQTQREICTILPKEVLGVAAKSIAAPIFEDGKLVGAIATITTLETQRILHESAQTIAATAEEISATTEELASSAGQLAYDLDSLKKAWEHVVAETRKTDDILQFVSEVATNSNLLGLNAAIEAARAGEHGRGFAVVADEVRKMADHSEKSVKDIKVILNSIQSNAAEVVKTIMQTAQLGERQAAVAEQISASVAQLASSATDVKKIAEIM